MALKEFGYSKLRSGDAVLAHHVKDSRHIANPTRSGAYSINN